jgi:hypothetical protein
MKKLARVLGGVGVFGALATGVDALYASPSTVRADPTCWFCVSEGGRMICEEVPCG